MRTSVRILVVSVLLACLGASASAASFNPQEVAMVVENFVVDMDATFLGLKDQQLGNTHGPTTFEYRSALIGPHDKARVTEPLATREEWHAWRGQAFATLGGHDYVIDYDGYMKDTRPTTDPSVDPTYDIRWESTWQREDTFGAWAEGDGAFKFVDPSFSFDISVDPANPSEVTISGGASATLWGVVDLSISGSKNFGTGELTASAGVAVNIPVISDYIGSVASASMNFSINQKTGRYESWIEAEVFWGLWGYEETVNRGRIASPAKKVPPPPPLPTPRSKPVNTGRSNQVNTNGGLRADAPWPGWLVPPSTTTTQPPQGTTTDMYDPYGTLAELTRELEPDNYWNITQPSDQFETLGSHSGFYDPTTHAENDPFDPGSPGDGLGFSFQDPRDPWGGPGSGITIQPGSGPDIPEPATMALLGLAMAGLGGYVRRRRKAA